MVKSPAHPTSASWELRPGDLPSPKILAADPRLGDLENNAVFRYVVSMRRRAPLARRALAAAPEAARIGVTVAAGPFLSIAALVVGLMTFACLVLIPLGLFGALFAGGSGSKVIAPIIGIVGLIVWLIMLQSALAHLLMKSRARRAAALREVPPLSATAGVHRRGEATPVGPIPAEVVTDLRLAGFPTADFARGLWAAAISRDTIRRRRWILMALLTGAALILLAADRGGNRTATAMLCAVVFVLAERLGLEDSRAAYTRLAAQADALGRLRRFGEGFSLGSIIQGRLPGRALVAGFAFFGAAFSIGVGVFTPAVAVILTGIGFALGAGRAESLRANSEANLDRMTLDLDAILGREASAPAAIPPCRADETAS